MVSKLIYFELIIDLKSNNQDSEVLFYNFWDNNYCRLF